MADYYSSFTGAQIDSAIASGSTISNTIKVTGNISSSGGNLYGSNLYLSGHGLYDSGSTKRLAIGATNTFTGDISASGDLYLQGNDIYNDGTKRITLGDTNEFVGNISASGTIYGSNFISSSGTQTIDGNLTVQGNISASDHVVTNNITASGNISASGNLLVTGNATIDGNTTIKGNLTFGDSTSDSINFGAEVSSSILPDADGTYNLGSVSKRWAEVHTDDIKVQGDISASGDLYLEGNDIYNDGTKRLTLGSTNTFNGHISASGDLYLGGNDIKSGTGTTRLTLGSTNAFVGNVATTGNISASGTITAEHFLSSDDAVITDDLTVGGNITGSSTSTGSFGRTSTTTLDLASIQGNWTNAGNTIADLGSVTTCDINGGTINGITDLAVADGGTGVGTLTDGGVLLGSGTSAITAMAVLTDGQMIVGDGTTDPVAESGATLRTSIGVGTTDNVAFAHITASGNISASGNVYGIDYFDNDTNINTIYSPIAGGSGIVTTGTIGTGVWQGTVVASAYLDADTAHLTTDQTFSGKKTFSSAITASGDISASGKLYVTDDVDFDGDLNLAGTGSFGIVLAEQISSTDDGFISGILTVGDQISYLIV